MLSRALHRVFVVFTLLVFSASCAESDPPPGSKTGEPDGGTPNNIQNNQNNQTPNNGPNNSTTPPDGGSYFDAGPGFTATNVGGFPPVPENLPEVQQSFDIVVFGAGTGGSAAAIQAARMGANVAIAEDTDWVGGQMTAGGVSTMDEGPFATDNGIYAEFLERVESHYFDQGKRARRCGIRTVPCTEPHVSQQILREMLSSEGITLFERARPVASRVDNNRVGAIKVYQRAPERIVELQASVFIDATEYGDILPVVGAAYRLGNSNTDDGINAGACVQDVTVAPIIRRYDSVPGALKFSGPPPGYGPEVEAKFAEIVTANGIDWEAEGWGAGYPVNWKTHVSYRATPDSTRSGDSDENDHSTITKTGVNWANDYPHTVADIETRRFQAYCEAKLHTLHFLYYAQEILGVDDWALADDEGYDSPQNLEENDCPNIPAELAPLERHMNPIPYVRESRRMIGEYTVVADDIQRAGGNTPRRFSDAIAVGDYAMDLHACNEVGDFESGLESAADHPDEWFSGPFQIPLSALIARDIDGLVAAEKNISQSRLVSGATRLQPSTMHTGQAAGALAALAVDRGVEPRAIDAALVQDALVEAGQRLGVTKFSDVAQGSFFWPSVEFVSGRGLLIGKEDGSFGVTDEMTRAQAAIFLARLLDLDTSNPPASPTFTDVPTTSFAYAEIEAVVSRGITAGCGDGSTFCPSDELTRAQMATFLARGLNYDENTGGTPVFEDVPASGTHFPAIQWLAARNLINGCRASPPEYCPDDALTRGQAAVLARRVVVWSVDNP